MLASPIVLSCILAAVALTSGVPEDRGRDWRDEPARWLMESTELKVWRSLKARKDADEFLRVFWIARDPDLSQEGNPSRELFERRIAEANALFSEDGEEGILTDRGRVYLLVGPPSSLRQEYQRAPELESVQVRGRRSFKTRPLLVETWSWRPEDVGPELRRELKRRGWKPDLEVRFQIEGNTYALVEGEDLLRLAARSWNVKAGRE